MAPVCLRARRTEAMLLAVVPLAERQAQRNSARIGSGVTVDRMARTRRAGGACEDRQICDESKTAFVMLA